VSGGGGEARGHWALALPHVCVFAFFYIFCSFYANIKLLCPPPPPLFLGMPMGGTWIKAAITWITASRKK
jgi:hypothetical protein